MNYENNTLILKIGDFGASKSMAMTLTLGNLLHGTPYYIAPEIVLDTSAAYTDKCDIYALGAILYAMVK